MGSCRHSSPLWPWKLKLRTSPRAKGYIDGVAILDEGSAIIVVPVRLIREEAAQIGELVNRLTGIRFEHYIVDEPFTV